MSDKRPNKEREEKIKAYRRIVKYYNERNIKAFNIELKEFLNKYPNDDLGWYCYAKYLMDQGNYEEALIIIEEHNNNLNYMMGIDTVICLLELEKYEELYTLADKLYYNTDKSGSRKFLKRAMIYSLAKLGQTEEIDFIDLDYTDKQIMSYNQQAAIDHSKELNEEKLFKFNSNIDIKELFATCSTILPISTKISNVSNMLDMYFFDFPNIGKDEQGKSIDILKVVAIHNTYNIISMSPDIKVIKQPANTINEWNETFKKVLTLGKREEN